MDVLTYMQENLLEVKLVSPRVRKLSIFKIKVKLPSKKCIRLYPSFNSMKTTTTTRNLDFFTLA